MGCLKCTDVERNDEYAHAQIRKKGIGAYRLLISFV
jgi:hypothetical protein